MSKSLEERVSELERNKVGPSVAILMVLVSLFNGALLGASLVRPRICELAAKLGVTFVQVHWYDMVCK